MPKAAAKPARVKPQKKSSFALAKCDAMTFVATAKPAEARRFYEGVLRFSLTRELSA